MKCLTCTRFNHEYARPFSNVSCLVPIPSDNVPIPHVTDGWNPHLHCLHWPSKLICESRFLQEIFFFFLFESFVKKIVKREGGENSSKFRENSLFDSGKKKYGSIDASSKKFYHRDGKIFYSIFTVQFHTF